MVQVVLKKIDAINLSELKNEKKESQETQIINDGINRYDDTTYIVQNQVLKGKFQKKLMKDMEKTKS